MLDPDGTSVMMLGADLDLIGDAWVEAIEDDVVDFEDEVVEIDDELEPEQWRAQPTAEPRVFDDDGEPREVFAPVPYRQRAADPELDALVTWFVHELCHAPRRATSGRAARSFPRR